MYFTNREDRTIIWMCKEEQVSCTWEAFMRALRIPVSTRDELVGVRPHTAGNAKNKILLGPYQTSIPYTDAKGKPEVQSGSLPVLGHHAPHLQDISVSPGGKS